MDFIHLTTSPALARRLAYTLIATISLVIANPSIWAQTEAVVADSSVVDSTFEAFKPLPANDIEVKDADNDDGGSILISWGRSPDDIAGGKVKLYKILRAAVIDGVPGQFVEVGDRPRSNEDERYTFEDGNTSDDSTYYYKVVTVNSISDDEGQPVFFETLSDPVGAVSSSAQWFDWRRKNVLAGVLLLSALIIFYINRAKAGKQLYIRRIAGMEAVDEAVGRATEMGKKIFYITGLGDMDNMQTIASVTILGRVAELAAQYETYMEVPCNRSLVMVTAKEVVKEAYSKAGRPDSFQEDQVHYLTDDQFGYAAAVDGMFVREKPATIFFMGQFFAESLILAETGNSIGAIQIAGTAMPAQLPFFVAACDYTLIGEELFAASSYLSKEPKLLGSLKGQDIGKGILLLALIVGIVLESLGWFQLSNWFSVIE